MTNQRAIDQAEGLLSSRLGLPGLRNDPALVAARNALGAPPTEAEVDAYFAALASALGGVGRLAEFAAIDLGFLPRALRDEVRRQADSARIGRRDLEAHLRSGPVRAELSAPGFALLTKAADEAVSRRLVAHLPIDSVGLAVDAGALTARGTGYLRAGEMGGVLGADLGAIKVLVAALLEGRDGGLSVLALIRADFRPAGIQLGLGFSLDSVGGLFGLNRTANVDALRNRLGDGSALDALFGGSIASSTSVRRAISGLAELFPPSPGEVVVGPTVRLGWLNVLGGSLVRLDLGVILTLPRGRVVVPGRILLEVPGPGVPLVHLRLDVLGDIDLAGRRAALDAALVDSSVLGAFRISGTAAAYLSWGDPAVAVMTVGGFFPGFDPRPAIIAPQRRIAFGLSVPLPGLRFSAEGYVAVTTGTMQLGGSISAAYDIGIAAVRGSVTGDAFIQFAPLAFTARLSGSAAIEALDKELVGVRLTAVLSGPGPLTVELNARAKILWARVGGSKKFVVVPGGGPARTPADVLREVVERELRAPSNIAAADGADPHVRAAPATMKPTMPLIPPTGSLVWRQDRFPLGATVEKADGRLLTTPTRIELNPPGSQRHREQLATSQYLDLTDSEVVSVPPFLQHDVGIRIPMDKQDSPRSESRESGYQTYVIRLGKPNLLRNPDLALFKYLAAVGYSKALLATSAGPSLLAEEVNAVTTVAEEQWITADDAGQSVKLDTPGSAVAEARQRPDHIAVPAAAFAEVAI